MIDAETLAEWKTIAEAATPGPWTAVEGNLEGKPASEYVRTVLANREADGTSSGRLFLAVAPNDIDPEKGGQVVPALTGDGPRAESNATHIATFDPPTVLALIAEVERLRDGLASSEHMRRVQTTDRTAEAMRKVRAERDSLQAQVDAVKAQANDFPRPPEFQHWPDFTRAVRYRVDSIRAALGEAGDDRG